ncbi:MAG: choice-of-anchor Q domain-containing protein [bacterium]
MRSHRSNKSFRNGLTMFEWLRFALVALLIFSPVEFATERGRASTPEFNVLNLPMQPVTGLTIVVNTTGDGDALNPNADCDADAGTMGEQCTLRAAIQRANAVSGDDAITFNIPTSQPNCDAGTGKCTINLTKALPDLSTNVALNSPDTDKLTVRRDTGGDYRIFKVTTNGAVSFSGMRIENGNVPLGDGGGISNVNTGTVTITDSVVTSNKAMFGAGIHNLMGGTVNVTNSSIIGNIAEDSGGGILNNIGTVNVTSSLLDSNRTNHDGGGISFAASGTVTISNSMIGNNSAAGDGGGIHNQANGTVNVTNSSIFVNFAGNGSGTGSGGGIRNAGVLAKMNVSNCTLMQNLADSGGGISNGNFGTSTVKNTIIAGSVSSSNAQLIADALGSFTSDGFNFIGDKGGSTGFTQATDQVGTSGARLDPRLFLIPGPSGFNNGILLPSCGSPVIDKATSASLNGALTTDVRGAGFPRTNDAPLITNVAGGDGTDIGAFERAICTPSAPFTVNTTGDANDVNPGDAVCDSDTATTGSQCTLRAALSETNAVQGVQSIDFVIPTTDPGFDSATGRYTINLTKALPDISRTDLTISGPGADKLTVRRNSGSPYSVFRAVGNFALTISGLTINNGVSHNSGGGVGVDGGALTLTDCVIADNFAPGGGGGISFFGNAKLKVTNCKFNGNVTTFSDGGGILVTTGEAEAEITNCTFNDNSANIGGGISAGLSKMTITNSTFTNNSATNDGGGVAYLGFDLTQHVLTINNSTFKNNSADFEGGAIVNIPSANLGGTLDVTNCTVSGNFAGLNAGGIFNKGAGVLNVTNSTVSGNSANNDGGGVMRGGGTVQVESSIIAGNTAFNLGGKDVSGAFTSAGFNLIGNTDNSTGFTVATDQTGTTASPLDPKLDPAGLQNNGGRTQTIALIPTSPAIDKGTANGLTGALAFDQRGTGFTRTFDDPAITPATGGDNTDIGAFERNPAAPTPTPTPTPSPTPTPTSTPSTPTFVFDSSVYTAQEDCTSVAVRVLRIGPAAAAVSVEIATEDNTAKQKGDYTLVAGRLVFAPGEAEKTFQVLINEDNYAEGMEFATLVLQHPEGGTVGAPGTATLQITDDAAEGSANPIDDSRTFTCEHYHDFLYRQSDQAGEDFWTQQIEQCGTDQSCQRAKRVDVSTAFFLSTEFQQTGYFVIRAHKAAFGSLRSNPRYEVFLRDQREVGDGVIVGQPGFQQLLDANRQKYLEDFVTRPEFVALFPQGSSAAAYVQLLFSNAGATPTQSERDTAITAYGSGDTAGRAAALQSVVESGSLFNSQYNSAFVLMQYYGYLRRNPDDAPDNNFSGYDFWQAKLDSFTLPGEDARNESVALARVRRAEMVKAFIESAEYRQRFGGALGGNQQGSIEP